MANSYSNILALALPAKGDLDWDDEVNGNFNKLESHTWQKTLTAPRALVCENLGVGSVGAYLVGSQQYYYKITALTVLGETTVSNETTVVEGATPYPIRLSWQPVAGATGYKVYKSTTPNNEQFLVQLGVVTSYDDAGYVALQVIDPPVANTAQLLTIADTVDGFHASQSPAAGEIPVITGADKYPAKDGSLIVSVNAAMVDGFSASATPTAGTLLALDGVGQFPTAALKTGTGADQIMQLDGSARIPAVNGSLITAVSDSDKVDGFHASQSPVANQIPVLNGSGQLPAIDGSLLIQDVGAIGFFATDVAPSGWLLCDFAAVSRSTYAALFNKIFTKYGAGDGSTTFNLPELRGEFLRCADESRGIDSGRTSGSYQADVIKDHYHYTASNPSVGGYIRASVEGAYAGTGYPTGFVVSGAGAETRPRNVALIACIKY